MIKEESKTEEFKSGGSGTGGSGTGGSETEEFRLGEKKTEHLLQLISIYLSEWDHRSTMLWNQVFKYFYATLIIIFLPNLSSRLGIDLPDFPKELFTIAAILLSCIFLYVSIGCAKRAEAIGNTYQRLVELLPKELHRVSVFELDTNQKLWNLLRKELGHASVSELTTKLKKYFTKRMSYVICKLMFFVLVLLSFIMFFYY